MAASTSRKVVVASDHAALGPKQQVCRLVEEQGFAVEDLGPVGPDSVDYPDYAAALCAKVVSGEADQGILLCGSGIGMSIAANKVNGIRAALVHDVTTAALSRQHNDANVLCLGGGMIGERLLTEIVQVWLSTAFEAGRHSRRVEKMMALENADANTSVKK